MSVDPTLQGLSAVLGHETVVTTVDRIVTEGFSSGAFLFWGPDGIGKRTAALLLCRKFLCTRPSAQAPCGDCPSCRTGLERHPDVRVLGPGEAASIGIDPVREFVRGIQEAPLLSPLRTAIIDEAHLLTNEAANSLLKTLEEPPPGLLFFLLTSAPDRLLPTLRSRLLTLRFKPLLPPILQELARARFPERSPEEIQSRIPLADGSLSRLSLLLDPSEEEVHRRTLAFLEAFKGPSSVDMEAVTGGFSKLADRDSFDRFLDALERLLLLAERHLAGVPADPSWAGTVLPERLSRNIPDFRRAQLHDKIGEMRRLAIHNINRGLALEQFFWHLEHSFSARSR